MVEHYIIGVGALVLLSAAWLGVQRVWKRAFADLATHPDALAGRPRCYGCTGSGDCRGKEMNRACEAQEKRP